MIGYEALVRVSASPSWGSQGTLSKRGIILYCDSVRPVFGAQVRERDNKLTGARESSGSTYSVDDFYPTCEITWQPRADDILPFLLAHFQNGTCLTDGTTVGTYQFTRIDKNLQFVTNGSNWGTHPYSLDIDVFFSNSLVGVGTGANGYRFFNCIVDKLTITGKYGEDFKAVAMVKSKYGSRFNFPAGIASVPNIFGSLSDYAVMSDWMGTAVITGEDYDIDSIELTFDNKLGERSRIGQRGYNRYPLSQHWLAEGNIGMELNRDLNFLAEGTSHQLSLTVMQGTGNWMTFNYHNLVYRPTDPDIPGGQQVIDITLPFRAYPTVTGGTSCVVQVCAGTTFGTNLFNFFGLP